jgi:hypothetical protein
VIFSYSRLIAENVILQLICSNCSGKLTLKPE